jgi:hypothetical protein
MVDLIAAEYGWGLEEILRLTVDQANILIQKIGGRLKRQAMDRALGMRLAIASCFDKEGFEAFQAAMEEAYESNKPIVAITAKDLAKFGMGVKKNG